MQHEQKIAVIIPCYKVRNWIGTVLAGIPAWIDKIYIVDDACPEKTYKHIENNFKDSRISILKNSRNMGVGGAMKHGYQQALLDGMDIMIKVDGDAQMDLNKLNNIVSPLLNKVADYTKGNRFYALETLASMPVTRIIGNTALSFINKLTSGYWQLMDPTNGYTAIHRDALEHIPLTKIDDGYFFESDMLFRLYLARAVIKDVPIPAQYQGQPSQLNVFKVSLIFPVKYCHRFLKRLLYTYFIRDFNAGSMQFVTGLGLFSAGTLFGIVKWLDSIEHGTPATAGTVMLAALPIIVGVQLLLNFINYDISSVPVEPLQTQIK